MDTCSILLVDDEEELVSTLAERLQFRGFDAEFALNGTEAIKKIERRRFDVSVIDIKLPVISGIELMKLIKQLQPDIKIILMTGHGSTEEAQAGSSKGAFSYLIKPVQINDLIESIKLAAKS